MTTPYKPKLKPIARKLRKEGTLSEKLLWLGLKKKNVHGYRFNRQKPLGDYVVDFYCHALKLVIEIDGISHVGSKKLKNDERRQKELEKMGLTILRLHDEEVKKDPSAAIQYIAHWIGSQK